MTRFLPTEQDLIQTFTPQKVPYAWTAIEVLESGQYSNANDVWSFAVTLWEIFSHGAKPWKDLNVKQVLAQLQMENRLEQPFICSEEIFSLMSRCWNKEPKERLTFTKIISQLERMKPQFAIAKMDSPSNLDEDQCVPYRKDDIINIVEKKLGDYWIGQSQVNLKSGYVLSSDMETDTRKIHAIQRIKSKRKKQRNVPTPPLPPPPPSEYQNLDDFAQFRKKNIEHDGDSEHPYDNLSGFQQENNPPDDETPDIVYEEPDTLSKPSKDQRYFSVCLANRMKITDSVGYTTMSPGGVLAENNVDRELEERGLVGDESGSESEDPPYQEIARSFDAYETHQRQADEDSDGYHLLSEIDTITLRKIDGDYKPKNAFYDDTINSDSALTPEQLTMRKRASKTFEKRGDLNPPRKNNYENSPTYPKPIPPPKSNKLKLFSRQNTDTKIVKKYSRPINESILSAEFPQIPDNEISVILEMSLGSLTEARKDAKFRIFREHMLEQNPMLQSVFCYDVFQKSNFDSEKAENVIMEKYSKRREDGCYEYLS
ncbi:Mucin-5AC-like [Oopsacas minuta]|uniref:Mucin-5AC-like n=1 Tax=Oopsacas minuta TaxID=111878 RepID=A0AAV7JWG7_9METZ|nr:Mucin-5AC-like [Oopsacas minuta]